MTESHDDGFESDPNGPGGAFEDPYGASRADEPAGDAVELTPPASSLEEISAEPAPDDDAGFDDGLDAWLAEEPGPLDAELDAQPGTVAALSDDLLDGWLGEVLASSAPPADDIVGAVLERRAAEA